MARTHWNAFAGRQVLRPRLPASAEGGRRPATPTAPRFADQWGYESTETDWRELVARDDIDLIDIASPNDTHAEIAIAAAQAGKMVMREKPLDGAPRNQKRWSPRSKRRTCRHGLVRLPAGSGVTLARQIIDEGRLGRIFHYRAIVSSGLDDLTRLPQGGAAPGGSTPRGRQRRHGRPAGALHRHRTLAERRHRPRRRQRRLSSRTHTSSAARRSRSGSTTPAHSWPASTTARSRRLRRRATRAATRRCTRSKSMASTPRSPGISTI